MSTNTLKNWLKKIKLNEATVSTVLGALVVIVIGFLVFNYFNKLRKEGETTKITQDLGGSQTEKQADEKTATELPTKHKVVSGETLWQIAEKYYQSGYNWVDIARENSLSNPDEILEGQELAIPKVEVKTIAQLPVTGEADSTSALSISGDKYVVQNGDCLWEIAVRAYGDGFRWTEIAQANNLANPDIIHAANEFTVPRK